MIPRGSHHEEGRLCPRQQSPSHRPRDYALVFLLALAVALIMPLAFSPSEAAAIPTSDAFTTKATPTTRPLVLYGDAQRQVEDLNTKAAAIQAEIDALDEELERATEAYNETAVKLDQTNVALNQLRRELAKAQDDHDRHQRMLEERIRSVYKSGGRDQLLPMLFLASGAEDLYKRIMVIAQLAERDNQLVEDFKQSKATLGDLLARVDAQKREELGLRRHLAEARTIVEAKLAQRQGLLAGIDSRIQEVLEVERERQAEEEEQARQALLADGGQNYSGPLPQGGDPVLNQILETAFFYRGVPYVWAGDRPSTGFDCSGFTQYVFAQHGVQLPHYSGYQAQMGVPVNLPDIQPGDLLAFGFPVHHVGIYVGEGMFIHAPRTGDVVKLSKLSERTNLADIRRFPMQFRAGPPAVR